MDPLHPSSTPSPSHVQSTLRLNTPPPPFFPQYPTLPQRSPLAAASNVTPANFVLLYPVYVCYIVILFVTDEATIKAKRFICFLKESRVTLSFVVKSKLVTVLSLFPERKHRRIIEDLMAKKIMRFSILSACLARPIVL